MGTGMIGNAIRRTFFWMIIFGAVIITVKNFPDQFQEAATAYRNGNYTEAFRLWRKLAQRGDVAAQYNMGALYATGTGTETSEEEAHRWFLQAALSGNAEAQFETAKNYEFGRGVAVSMPDTIDWLRRSAQQGYTPAQIDLGLKYLTGNGLKKDLSVAETWFSRAVGADRKPQVLSGLDAATAVTGRPCDGC